MRYVIQCAGSKQQLDSPFYTTDGRSVAFVADPGAAPITPGVLYVHPDDRSDATIPSSPSWRELILSANNAPAEQGLGLLPASMLYKPPAYALLADWAGIDGLFILSAGWGLVRSDFLLPDYDITFSGSAQAHKRRRKKQLYRDINALRSLPADDTIFLGGKDYLPLFLSLTAETSRRRLIFYNSAQPPAAPGCLVQAYRTAQRTNWHYTCAADLVRGTVRPFETA